MHYGQRIKLEQKHRRYKDKKGREGGQGAEGLVPCVREVVEASGAGEDHDANLSVAENGKLLSLLQKPVAALGEGHLPAGRVVDPADHNLPPPHSSTPIIIIISHENFATCRIRLGRLRGRKRDDRRAQKRIRN